MSENSDIDTIGSQSSVRHIFCAPGVYKTHRKGTLDTTNSPAMLLLSTQSCAKQF